MYDPHRPVAGQAASHEWVPVRGRRRWPWWFGGVAVVVALLMVAGAVVIVARGRNHPVESPGAAAPPAPPAPDVPTTPIAAEISVASLPSYLASAQQISAHLAGVAVNAGPLMRKAFSGFTVDPFECVGAVIPGSDVTYSGSRFTGFAGQAVADAANDHRVIQAVVLLQDASGSAAVFNDQAALWQRCSDKPVIVDDTAGKVAATVSAFTVTDDIASVLITLADGTRQCQHAMSPARNAIVDVRVCVPAAANGDAARAIVRDSRAAIDATR